MKAVYNNANGYYPMPEHENLDLPGVDHFAEYHGIYYTFQPNLNSSIPLAGRWVLTDNLTNPAIANIAWYDDAYTPIYEAIQHFQTLLNEQR